MPGLFEDMPETSTAHPSSADLSAEHAASAAEAASRAAQSAAGAVERLGAWMALLVSRAPQTSPGEVPQGGISGAALVVAKDSEREKQGAGVTEKLQRVAKIAGQRISEVSEGRFGLAAEPSKAETKYSKKAEKRLERQAWKEAKAEQPGANVNWFPWMLGMSLGLLIGLLGVAYWKRQRLQAIWERTSHRMQQATGEMRHQREVSHQQLPTMQPDISAGAPHFSPPSSSISSSEMNQQVNGRLESTWQ